MGISYRGAHCVAHTEVKATLFIHGVVQTRKLRQRRPVVVKGVITETVIGAARRVKRKIYVVKFYFLHFFSFIYSCHCVEINLGQGLKMIFIFVSEPPIPLHLDFLTLKTTTL